MINDLFIATLETLEMTFISLFFAYLLGLPLAFVCEQINRKCYMMEKDPKYADVIIDRWEKLTGQKAVKVN